jgi:hypothetical protein
MLLLTRGIYCIAISSLFCVITMIALPRDASAQVRKPKSIVVTKPASTYWIAEYSLSIVGNGTVTSDDGDTENEWSINRTYSGIVRLNTAVAGRPEDHMYTLTPQQEKAANASQRFTEYGHEGSNLLVRIEIHDNITNHVLDKGEGKSFEDTTQIKTWTMDKVLKVRNRFSLTIDSMSHTYSVRVPLIIIDDKATVTMKYLKTVKRSNFGYGDKPTSDPPVTETKELDMVSFGGLPNSRGLIEGRVAVQTPFLPLMSADPKEVVLELPALHPDQPMIEGVPESKDLVKIYFKVKFTRMY